MADAGVARSGPAQEMHGGTLTRAASRLINSWSIWASRVVIACELPTATASASTPVAAVKDAASSGSVRAPSAWAFNLPPISPS